MLQLVRGACAVALVGFSGLAQLSAQNIHGSVVDEISLRPLANVSVMLLNPSGIVLTGTLTDEAGFYAIAPAEAGRYILRVDADEYTSLVSPPFDVAASDDLEIELRIKTQIATELATVTVSDSAPRYTYGVLADFYERVERGLGQYVTREDIEAKGDVQFTSLLRGVPGVRVVPLGGRYVSIRIKGTQASRILGIVDEAEPCVPVIYVDGTKMGPIDDVMVPGQGPDLFLFSSEIEGIEVYRASTVPAEYSGSEAMCGVIVVWTRR